MKQLNKLHNLMINCNSKKELVEHVVNLSVDNIYNDQYDNVFDSVLENPVLAAECTVLHIYYFQPTSYGMKQDRNGTFYKV